MAIVVQSFTFNLFVENTYLVHDDTTACIVDPGCCNAQEEGELADYIGKRGLRVEAIVNTHCHIDHVLGNAFCKERWSAPLLIPEHEQNMLQRARDYAVGYGIADYRAATADGLLAKAQLLRIGTLALRVLFTPGHSPGHVVFYEEKEAFVMGGDVLFFRSIGRTDLPGGNHQLLIESIHREIFCLPDHVKVYPGHGQVTSVGEEKRLNPFCARP